MSFNSFLFATNNDSLIFNEQNRKANNTFISKQFDATKWNEWQLPVNYKDIKQLVCGAICVVICTGTSDLKEKFFYRDVWFKLKWNENLKKNLKVKKIFVNYSETIIQLENDEIIIDNVHSNNQFVESGIKFIACGPVSNHYIVVDKNEKIHYFRGKNIIEQDIDTNEIKEPIKCIGCSGSSDIVVTTSNKMYGHGDNQFNVLAGVVSRDKFSYIKTPFEKESEIVDVKCGYYYTAVLLRNSTVYSVGNNTHGSCDLYSPNTAIPHFTKLKCDLFDNNVFFTKIYCSSRGIALITNKQEAFLIGEVVYDLQQYDGTINGITSYTINNEKNKTIHKIKLDNGFNDIAAGGWHYIIYNNVNLNGRKSLIYFENNLYHLSKENNNNLSDVNFL
ncbi:hypothetical protein ABK040_014763 [Willaertia magna]